MSTLTAQRIDVGAWLAERDRVNRRVVRTLVDHGRVDIAEACFGADWARFLLPAEPVKAGSGAGCRSRSDAP